MRASNRNPLFFCYLNLTNIGGTFGKASAPQRLKNHSLYQEILLLQKFDDISWKVKKKKKISLQPQKKLRPFYSFLIVSDGSGLPGP